MKDEQKDGLDVVWRSVEKSDPSNTKHVNQRGGFTAITAHSQIKEATRVWGPAGGKWWWDVTPTMLGDLVIMRVELHHPHGERPVVQFGGAVVVANGRADDDAYKKAVTDGLTKCLSYLGFNADIFLGKFDDNKYVTEARKEFAEKAKAERKAPPNETIQRVSADQVEKIQELSAKLKGDAAADLVARTLKKKKAASLEDLSAADGMQFIMWLNGQLAKEEG